MRYPYDGVYVRSVPNNFAASLGSPSSVNRWEPLLGLILFVSALNASQRTYAVEPSVFPSQWTMPAAQQPALPAASGNPRIELWRQGKLLAAWSSMGAGRTADDEPFDPQRPNLRNGPFRRGVFRELMDGDVFRVLPAVYDAPGNGIYIGPNWNDAKHYQATASQGALPYVPKRIMIQGVTVAGQRPVIRIAGAERDEYDRSVIFIEGYLDPSSGKYVPVEDITIENIDIDGSRGVPGRAAIFLNGCRNCTFRDMRISNYTGSHGILSGPDTAGTLRVEQVEFDHVGGGNGPDHPIYAGASARDPNFKLHARGVWARYGTVGHLLKSRAQVNVIEACYFEGHHAADGQTAESYLVDISEGGRATVRNNIFVKNYSGEGANGVALTFGPELTPAMAKSRAHDLVVEGNLFVTFAATWNKRNDPSFPLRVWPAVNDAPIRIRGNAFVGYRPTGQASFDRRGTDALFSGFDNLTLSYDLKHAPDAWRARPGPRYIHQSQFQ